MQKSRIFAAEMRLVSRSIKYFDKEINVSNSKKG